MESARALAVEQAEERVEEQSAAEQTASFTWRGFAVGTLLALGIGVGAPYAVIMLQGSYMALNSSSPGAIFLFFVLVVVINTLLRALGRGPRLGAGRFGAHLCDDAVGVDRANAGVLSAI